MVDVFCDEQLAALAESENGDPTWAPLAGLLTVTLARAGAARVASSDEPSKNFL
jgi:hypothetical protein